MITTLLIIAAAIALAVVAYLQGFKSGKALGLSQRINTAMPRELVPTRQLRRAAGRQIAKRITLAAAKGARS